MEPDWYEEILRHLDDEKEDGRKVRIYRVPNYLKEKSPEDFRPLELFVGFYTHSSLVLDQDPMHLDISKLAVAQKICLGQEPHPPPVTPEPEQSRRPTETQKWRDFVSHLEPNLELARSMYDRLTVNASGNAVVALDSLFIVAYLRYSYSWADTWGYDFASVFERSRFNASRFPVLHDLLMLENQVPLLLLDAVVKYICTSMTEATADLYNMLEWFVMEVYPFNHGEKLDVDPEKLKEYLRRFHKNSIDSFVNCDHLLHCAYLAICGPYNPIPRETSDSCGQILPCFRLRNVAPTDHLTPSRNRFRIPSATSLRRVGISVKVRDSSLTMNNIKFERHKHKYVLLVPKLIMNDGTVAVLRNLALYEQIEDNGVTPRGDMRTYLFLMSSLIDSVQDVRLLMNRGVIVNQLGSAETVCKQWNRICDGLYIPSTTPSYWSHIQDRINELEKSKSNRWFAEVEERNFSSFVLFGSFLVFTIIFFSTLIQAIFSVLSYASMP
ncbi:hypothetical protein MPTK1_6g14090 [Marchantia polymorpha subsp. ruderalis]|uniref:Uncharacterized protein n=2 Tax=Marchantia polymorpha TaxID=3197 RepID=A0AAF6BRV6_MARPO|nr:hypothetical protein MARPO_0047s0063 [Marchantia polymorpha]BBN14740.1 hypothetical protein Mp_6g14090 [Marchantia polymorpha subsp. ruderalis]|eukprot:PTQ39083.1 hypothetical protein MARPO_0047s0063 [Marchantia polymorpha]